ncbi:MAG: hypothetical protein UT41_C0001G0169 [Candidatus Wolfebacteria bacterium GW2011_GWC2_39_22]|uniref:Uncharacterized protein n=1 Tax=Candidatus Wolfebacteria bacterium GW2011_GWC2_39_22 TaxID=1619013 RepID=A0A0G0QQH7_9BACT|nr:MAG: hypothetical protein UT41_C0001G0169 [Candidatus Wolfebacteria bacterium GW2011_GWC2_39_22]HBI26098.1 hypothetical protein [Candidatus Wolfebacteria bacterium]
MHPSEEGIRSWHTTMQTIQALVTLTGEDMEYINPLLQGILLTALRNPFLRMITIDGTQRIAGVRTYIGDGVLFTFADNPLENNAPELACRARIELGRDDEIIIEQNMGPRQKDHIERTLDEACSTAGNVMMRSGDYTGEAGRRFSTLLHMTTRGHGDRFEWAERGRHKISEFKGISIIERTEEWRHGKTTFDLTLTSKIPRMMRVESP